MVKSKKIPCNVCGKLVRARGLQGHLRLKHPPTNSTLVINLIDSCEIPNVTQEIKSDSGDNSGSLCISSESISETSNYIALDRLQADLQFFVPTVAAYIKYYKKQEEKAKNDWIKLSDLRKKYLWIEFNIRYRALYRIFGLKGH